MIGDLTVFSLVLITCTLSQSALIEIDNTNFKDIESRSQVVLYFYEQNCSKCDSFYKEMIEIIDNVSVETNITFAKINATRHPSLLFLYQIRDLPTIVGLRQLNLFPYNYKYESNEFLRFINETFIMPVPQLKDKIEFDSLLSTNESFVIGYFNELHSKSAEAFKTACLLVNYVKCTVTESEHIRANMSTIEDSQINLVKQNDGRMTMTEYAGNYTSVSDIKHFIQLNEMPPYSEYDKALKSKLFDHPVKLHLLIFLDKSASDFSLILDEVKVVSKILFGKALTILFDIGTSLDIDQTLQLFDFNRSDTPTFAFIKIKNYEELKYKSRNQVISSANIIQLYEEIVNGSVKADFKSETLPSNWNSSNVILLVKDNYKNITENKNSTVLVNFYSDSCIHSKELDQIWQKLGELYNNKSEIVISQINTELNEIEGFPIYSTPSIYLYRKTNKNRPVQFDKERTLEDLINFIENDGETSEMVNEKVAKENTTISNDKDEL